MGSDIYLDIHSTNTESRRGVVLTPFGVLGVGPKMTTQGVQKHPCEMQQIAPRGVEGYTAGTTLNVSHTKRVCLGFQINTWGCFSNTLVSKSTPSGTYPTPPK